jgi:ABC-type uncharacterized transport system permease subunit
VFVGAAIHAVDFLVPPPQRLPYLWTYALTCFAFLHFATAYVAALYALLAAWRQPRLRPKVH